MTATLAAPTTRQRYERYVALVKEARLLRGVSSLLGWDQETQLPPKATPIRAEEMALMAGLIHDRAVADELGDLLDALADARDLDAGERANIRETKRSYDRQKKLPRAFVEELSRTTAVALDAWKDAKKKASWATFAPHLEKIVGLKRQEAEHVGYEDEAYDALLDEYEPRARAKVVGPVLESLKDALVPLVQAIAARPGPAPIPGPFPRAAQESFSRQVAEAMGFDFAAGRLDVSAHPFCSGFQPNDVRLTTRYNEADLRQALFGVIHEAGHGLYEQGLRVDRYGTPLAEAASTAMHESQSRLWENVIARSRPFWEHFFPLAQRAFPEALSRVELDHWYRYVNEVRPSLIRVEADEATYNLHILLRFEIERALFAGALEVRDLPAAWNEKVRSYLGLTPPDDAKGVLQDIHWSFGGFGYFPTYSLGNLYAAQLIAAAERALPTLWADVRRGDLLGLKSWLNREVHARGMLHPPGELIAVITGEPLSPAHFVRSLTEKLTAIYGL